jgi:hypothetical protein
MVALPLPRLQPAFKVGDILITPLGQRRLPVLDVRVLSAVYYQFDTGYGFKWYAESELKAYKIIPFPEPPAPASRISVHPLNELIAVFTRASRGAGTHGEQVLVERCATLRRETLATIADMQPHYRQELALVWVAIEEAEQLADDKVEFTAHLNTALWVLRLAVGAAEKVAA